MDEAGQLDEHSKNDLSNISPVRNITGKIKLHTTFFWTKILVCKLNHCIRVLLKSSYIRFTFFCLRNFKVVFEDLRS